MPQEMEDKWDIYFHEDHLYFARSWTGNLIYRADCKVVGHYLIVSSILAMDEFTFKDDRYAVRAVDFLIKSHLLRMEVPHPLPAIGTDDVRQIVMFSFSEFGRWASFATFEETIEYEQQH